MSKSSIKSITSKWSSMGSCRFSAPQVAAMIGQKMGRGHMERLVTRQQGSHGSWWLVGWYLSISRNSPTSSHFYWWIATRTSYPINHTQDVSIDNSGSIDMGWEWMGMDSLYPGYPTLCSSQTPRQELWWTWRWWMGMRYLPSWGLGHPVVRDRRWQTWIQMVRWNQMIKIIVIVINCGKLGH